MAKTQVTFEGAERVRNNIGLYGDQVREAVRAVADYWAPVIEAYAKDNAIWTDQTGNARQTLRGFVDDLSRDTVAIYLTHGMTYGRFLELKYQGRYAIILDALEEHYYDVYDMLKGIFE